LFGNPVKAIRIIQPNQKTPPRSIFEADGTDLGTLEGALPVPSNTCARSGELQIADVRDRVALSLFDDFGNFSVFRPRPLHEKSLAAMLDQLVAWGGALRTAVSYC
jgi:hypothetical protein